MGYRCGIVTVVVLMLKFILFVTAAVAVVIAWALPWPQTKSRPAIASALPSSSAPGACYEAQRYIKNALKAPASAAFSECDTHVLNGSPVVYTSVNAENSFGGRDWAYFMCPVKGGQVQCIETDADHKTTLRVF